MYKVVAAVVTLLVALGGPGFSLGQAAHASVSPAVGKALNDARAQAGSRSYAAAVASAKQALALAKNGEEKGKSLEMLAYIYNVSGNRSGAADTLESMIASGQISGGQVATKRKEICTLRYQAQQWDQAARVCTDSALVAQIYFQQRNYAKAAQVLRKSIGGGSTPSKSVLQTLARCYFELRDAAGTQWANEQMVTYYPEARYWGDLLTVVQNKVRNNTRYDLDILRLREATGTIKSPSGIMEMAQLALQLQLSSEAKASLERALAAGQIGKGQDTPREMRLVTMARTQDKTAAGTMAARMATATRTPTGEDDVRIGEILAYSGKADQGVAAIQAGIAKGGLKDPVEAQLRLGLAQYKAGKKDVAIRTLAGAKGKSPFADIARLWAIRIRNG